MPVWKNPADFSNGVSLLLTLSPTNATNFSRDRCATLTNPKIQEFIEINFYKSERGKQICAKASRKY